MTATLPPTSAPRVRVRVNRLVLYTLLVALTGLFIGPFGWLILSGLKTPAELAASPVHWLPTRFQWHNFADAFHLIDFLGYARNSLIIALLYATLVTLSSAWVGFGFARLDAPGKKTLFGILIGSMMLPQMITLLPTYLIFAKLGMVDTYWPWVFWGLAAAPYLVFLFRQFFAGLPRELEEAAIVDGCNQWGVFWRIMVPLARPAIATLAVLAFLTSWNEFLWPVFVLFSTDMLTLPAGLAQLQGENTTRYDLLMAGGVIASVPVLAVYVLAQRYIIEGVSQGGVKG